MQDRITPLKSLKDRAPTFVLAAYWIALVIGTHLPADQMPNTFSTADKALHIVAYAGLTILLAFTIYRTAPVKFWEFYLFFGLSLFGALDEYTQGFVGRMPDVLDWVADVFGIGLGLAGFLFAMSWWKNRQLIASQERVSHQ